MNSPKKQKLEAEEEEAIEVGEVVDGAEAPVLPADASILQCIKGLINIFEAAKLVEFPILDRTSMLPLFDGQPREQRLLHDTNVLAVLHAVYDVCGQDEVILRKLHTWTVHGTKRAVSGKISDSIVIE